MRNSDENDGFQDAASISVMSVAASCPGCLERHEFSEIEVDEDDDGSFGVRLEDRYVRCECGCLFDAGCLRFRPERASTGTGVRDARTK